MIKNKEKQNKFISKKRIKKIIRNRPANTSPEGIVVGLREKGYNLEGFEEDKDEKKKEKGISLKSVGNFVGKGLNMASQAGKGLLGFQARGLEAPEAFTTRTLSTVGEIAGYLSEGRADMAREALENGLREVSKIPGETLEGFKEGPRKEPDWQMPSDVYGLEGLEGVAVDVMGDPLNLLMVKSAKRKEFLNKGQPKERMKSIGDELYNFIKRGKRDFTDEYKRIGKLYGDSIKAEPENLGRQLARYNVKGSLDDMIGEVNKRIPKLSNQLDEVVAGSNKTVDITSISDDLDRLSKTLIRVGDDDTATKLQDMAGSIKETGDLPVDEALDMKRAFDQMRLTSTGRLSGSQSMKQRVYRIISDNLREKLNQIDEIGKLNKEMDIYYDALEELSNLAYKEAKAGKLPIKATWNFPFFRPTIGKFTKARTELGQAIRTIQGAIPTEKITQFKTLLPSGLRNLVQENERETETKEK